MYIRLVRDSRINHFAGEILEVSSAQAEFLLSVGSAVKAETVETADIKVEEVAEKAVKAPKATPKTKTTAKRTATKK